MYIKNIYYTYNVTPHKLYGKLICVIPSIHALWDNNVFFSCDYCVPAIYELTLLERCNTLSRKTCIPPIICVRLWSMHLFDTASFNSYMHFRFYVNTAVYMGNTTYAYMSCNTVRSFLVVYMCRLLT
jgi:hypothetical protein